MGFFRKTLFIWEKPTLSDNVSFLDKPTLSADNGIFFRETWFIRQKNLLYLIIVTTACHIRQTHYRRINCFAYSYLIFVLLDHEQRPTKTQATCKIKVACCKQGKIRKWREWLEDFYGNKTSVPDWYTTYGKSAIAAAGEFELMFTNTEDHMYKIVRILKTNQDNSNLWNALETKHH